MSKSTEIVMQTETATYSLMEQMNIMGLDKDIQKAMATAIMNSHNTIQQSFWRNILEVAKQYSEMPYSDLRNEASVELCKDIAKLAEKHHLPFV
jgi:hypothetical protein